MRAVNSPGLIIVELDPGLPCLPHLYPSSQPVVVCVDPYIVSRTASFARTNALASAQQDHTLQDKRITREYTIR